MNHRDILIKIACTKIKIALEIIFLPMLIINIITGSPVKSKAFLTKHRHYFERSALLNFSH